MKQFTRGSTWSLGAAIFAMFFGAGNVVFPLTLGLEAGDQIPWALSGLLLTAIGGPLLGLFTSLLYRGRCSLFFAGWGRGLGGILLGISLALLGPFCVLPRCCVVAYAAIEPLYSGLSPMLFTSVFSALALLVALWRSKLLTVLGRVLSPLLLACLIAIIATALYLPTNLTTSELSSTSAFFHGLEVGYDTMDLIASLIFASSIWNLMTHRLAEEKGAQALAGGLLGGALLGCVYVGMAWTAATHAPALQNTAPESLLSQIAQLTLGPKLALVSNVAVALACFTTVVSLLTAISHLLERELLTIPVGEPLLLTAMTMIMAAFATLGFGTIQGLLHPLLLVAYPLIIALTLYNLVWRDRNQALGL